MRISIHGAKGGVGKTTISITLALILAERGGKVVLLDRDNIGFASRISGIEDKGLVKSIVEKSESDPTLTVKVGKGRVTVIKMLGDGPRYEQYIQEILRDDSLKRAFNLKYSQILRSTEFDYFVVDNPSMLQFQDSIVKLDLDVFLSLYPNVEIKRVYVSDSSTLSIWQTVKYAKLAEEGFRIGSALGLVVNMVPPMMEEAKEREVREALEKIDIPVGVITPFYDPLFQYNGELTEFPILPQLRSVPNLLERKFRKDERIIIR
ncbi:ParA family protein [Metallosphaera tengchongensis]|uniref:ParA family protein n=1 Tax=Metallosphaera tengchongensis TaxID=1532350 RepID=A0A6N0NQM1_9CREN|nr:ParA family protein [Metallosphaera tengchongensis]QKQ99015.1 ParA family protein [Metallosphaera tengchongensis]